MSILAIGTAVPENTIAQSDIADFMAAAHGMYDEEKRQLEVLYRATGIAQRHSVIPDYGTLNKQHWTFYPPNEDLSPSPSTQDRGRLYKQQAIKLSTQAIDSCLAKSHLNHQDITHLITVSCTGMYAPGLDIDIINALDLDKSVQRTAINFMGCYAAITAIKQATHICAADKDAKVLIVCVELCTIHFQNSKTEDNLLANAIFSDGAAALLMSGQSRQSGLGLRPVKFHCDILPEGSNDMAWNIGDFGYEMKLSAYVPQLIESGIESLIHKLTQNLPQQPQHFAIHPGGKKILQVIEEKLGIGRAENATAHEVLRKHGNMSSPTVLFVLEQLMSQLTEEHRDQHVLSLAFGPGLTLESMLLQIV